MPARAVAARSSRIAAGVPFKEVRLLLDRWWRLAARDVEIVNHIPSCFAPAGELSVTPVGSLMGKAGWFLPVKSGFWMFSRFSSCGSIQGFAACWLSPPALRGLTGRRFSRLDHGALLSRPITPGEVFLSLLPFA